MKINSQAAATHGQRPPAAPRSPTPGKRGSPAAPGDEKGEVPSLRAPQRFPRPGSAGAAPGVPRAGRRRREQVGAAHKAPFTAPAAAAERARSRARRPRRALTSWSARVPLRRRGCAGSRAPSDPRRCRRAERRRRAPRDTRGRDGAGGRRDTAAT